MSKIKSIKSIYLLISREKKIIIEKEREFQKLIYSIKP